LIILSLDIARIGALDLVNDFCRSQSVKLTHLLISLTERYDYSSIRSTGRLPVHGSWFKSACPHLLGGVICKSRVFAPKLAKYISKYIY
jgi:hypothetical protein